MPLMNWKTIIASAPGFHSIHSCVNVKPRRTGCRCSCSKYMRPEFALWMVRSISRGACRSGDAKSRHILSVSFETQSGGSSFSDSFIVVSGSMNVAIVSAVLLSRKTSISRTRIAAYRKTKVLLCNCSLRTADMCKSGSFA
jgi:hypothetical protein